VVGGNWYLRRAPISWTTGKGQAQEQLGKDGFLPCPGSPDASDDPFAKGPNPVFRSDNAKYNAAAKEFFLLGIRIWLFESVSRGALLSRTFAASAWAKEGGDSELETVAGNSRIGAVGFLAKKCWLSDYIASGKIIRAP